MIVRCSEQTDSQNIYAVTHSIGNLTGFVVTGPQYARVPILHSPQFAAFASKLRLHWGGLFASKRLGNFHAGTTEIRSRLCARHWSCSHSSLFCTTPWGHPVQQPTCPKPQFGHAPSSSYCGGPAHLVFPESVAWLDTRDINARNATKAKSGTIVRWLK